VTTQQLHLRLVTLWFVQVVSNFLILPFYFRQVVSAVVGQLRCCEYPW